MNPFLSAQGAQRNNDVKKAIFSTKVMFISILNTESVQMKLARSTLTMARWRAHPLVGHFVVGSPEENHWRRHLFWVVLWGTSLAVYHHILLLAVVKALKSTCNDTVNDTVLLR